MAAESVSTAERTLSTQEIADHLGVGMRTVQLWTRRAPAPCPHTREKRIGGGRNELWFDAAEVLAWAASQGLDTTRMALFRPEDADAPPIPSAAAAENAKPGIWGATYKPKRVRVSDEELANMDAGSLLQEARREIMALLESMRSATAESAPQAVQQLVRAVSDLSKEERIHEDGRRKEEVRRGQVIDRDRVTRVLESIGVFVRQSLAAAALELPAAALAPLAGEVDAARLEGMTRALGARLREESEKTLRSMEGQIRAAVADITGGPPLEAAA